MKNCHSIVRDCRAQDIRLHSAIGYVITKTKLEGTEYEVFRIRKERLAAAKAKKLWEHVAATTF